MPINENTMIRLNLTIAEVNVILKSLGKHPFDEISTLISNIRDQGEKIIEQIARDEESEDK